MNGSQTMLTHSIASERASELRSQAQRDRLFADLSRQNGVPTPLDRARRVLGQAIVRTGELVGGDAGTREAAGTAGMNSVTVLRPVR